MLDPADDAARGEEPLEESAPRLRLDPLEAGLAGILVDELASGKSRRFRANEKILGSFTRLPGILVTLPSNRMPAERLEEDACDIERRLRYEVELEVGLEEELLQLEGPAMIGSWLGLMLARLRLGLGNSSPLGRLAEEEGPITDAPGSGP